MYSAAEVNIIFHFMSQHFVLFDAMMPCLFRCRILGAGIARHLRRRVADKRNDD
jgi:hypothetical protein